jgi:hypothetical protein
MPASNKGTAFAPSGLSQQTVAGMPPEYKMLLNKTFESVISQYVNTAYICGRLTFWNGLNRWQDELEQELGEFVSMAGKVRKGDDVLRSAHTQVSATLCKLQVSRICAFQF